jgi:glycosyltransferase involved in cell wall biosynthesis
VKILALAYVYPPDAGSGTYRSLYFLNHLAVHGEQITVITAREEDFSHTANRDRELMSLVNPRITVLRAAVRRPVESLLRWRDRLRQPGAPPSPAATTATAATAKSAPSQPPVRGLGQSLKDAVTTALTFPDEHVGWIPDVLRIAARTIASEHIDCIYSSGGPWSSHLAAALIKKKHGVPLVLDFRDPWASNPDLAPRSRMVRAASRWLEGFCVRAADQITLNTVSLRDDFIRRYPGMGQAKFTTITNGFEEVPLAPKAARGSAFTLVHAGEIYLSRNPGPFLRAVLGLIQRGDIGAGELKVQLVGGCSRTAQIDALLSTQELRGVVEIMPRVSHKEALQYQMQADALLLFQTGFPLQVPRKIFEYMSLMKPVLAIAEGDSATARIVEDSKVGVVAEQNVESITSAVLQLHRSWRSGGESTLERAAILKYRNDQLAARLGDVMRTASGLAPTAEAKPC